MGLFRTLAVAAVTVMQTGAVTAVDEGLVLASGKGASCPIVVAADATPAERYAAEELAAHLHRACGAAFPVADAPPGDGPAIVLACDPALAAEECRLRAEAPARRLVIAGGRPRGVLYGAYALLEDELGCRWYTRDADRVPRRDRLAVPAGLDRRLTPRLEYREVFWTEAFDGTWAARNRLNSHAARLEERHGGKVTYGPFVHTFEAILPAAQHFDAHPEWFSMVGGKRIKDRTQLCLTNPEVLQRAIAAVREWIRQNPAATIFSVSQNDWYNPCACPACKAVDDEEGSHAGTLIRFVNQVAEAIGTDHPDVAIDTLAYQYTRKPPRLARPRPNVIVRLCSIECCFAHPLDGCPEESNTSFLADLKGWNRLTNRLYVWDYTTDFAHYLLPFPNLDVLDDNVRTFAGNGVVGIFEQGNYSSGGGGELAELRAWVLAKLLWDPARDGEALIREFVAGVYGPAAPAVQRYLDDRRAAARRAGNHVRIFDGCERPDLAPADLRGWAATLAEAARAAGDDPALGSRVRRLRMPVWYAQVRQAAEPPAVLAAAARALAEAARAEKVTHFRESSRGLEPELRTLELVAARRARVVPEGVVDGEDLRFTLYREGDLAERIADPAADDGVAVRVAGRTFEWCVQWRPAVAAAPLGVRYRLRARVRVEKTGNAGAAFHAGIYDAAAKRGLGEKRVMAADVPDGAYRDYDIAEFDLTPGCYAYLAPDDNAANVKAVFIDRFELVPEAQPDPAAP